MALQLRKQNRNRPKEMVYRARTNGRRSYSSRLVAVVSTIRVDPLISVVLPVFNCPNYVGEAIDSVLSQSATDLELILIDDGSTDETPSVLARYKDARLRL